MFRAGVLSTGLQRYAWHASIGVFFLYSHSYFPLDKIYLVRIPVCQRPCYDSTKRNRWGVTAPFALKPLPGCETSLINPDLHIIIEQFSHCHSSEKIAPCNS